jgi:hypothetical protein
MILLADGVISLRMSTFVSSKKETYMSSLLALPLPVANFLTRLGGMTSSGNAF